MSEVQNIGAVDSIQYQPSQYAKEDLQEVYNTQPDVYDERMAEIQAANKSRAASLISAVIIGGLAYWGGHSMGKKAAKAELQKAKEAAKKYEETQKVLEEIKNKAEKIDKTADGILNTSGGVSTHGEKFVKNVGKIAKNILEKIKKLSETATDASEGASK